MLPPGFPPDDLDLRTDVPFSAHGLHLDVLRTRRQRAEPGAAPIHLHGGAWVRFSKWPVANAFLARAGFVTVSVDYRLAPASVFPAQLHDVKTAVRWVRAHAAEPGADPARIGIWGVGAGAHLAALAGTTAGSADLEGMDGGWPDHASAVQAVGNVSGPMDFFDPAMPFGDAPFELLGGVWRERQALARQASPVWHVTATSAPFLHVHGVHDDEVPVSQARRMHAALTGVGIRSELVELDGGHDVNDTHRAEVEARLLRFFRDALAFTPSVCA